MTTENTMSRNKLLTLLSGLSDPGFAEPVAMLIEVVSKGGARIAVSSRYVPHSELSTIYIARSNWCEERGIQVLGLTAFVKVLADKPDTPWKIVAISADELTGAVFVAETGKAGACLASTNKIALCPPT